MTPNYPEKVSSKYEEREAPVELASTVKKQYYQIFYPAIDMVVNCIRAIFQQKDYIETLQKMEMQLLVMNFSKYLSLLAVI